VIGSFDVPSIVLSVEIPIPSKVNQLAKKARPAEVIGGKEEQDRQKVGGGRVSGASKNTVCDGIYREQVLLVLLKMIVDGCWPAQPTRTIL
jgi:hypothetical protein